MCLVSVIIPNYNHSQFLIQRIESILNQTFQDFEIIILDDYSTDNSREIISTYSSHPKVVRTILNEKNGGNTFTQWEKGLEFAKGKYVLFAESDDWCEPGLLQYLIDGFDIDEECVISYCQSYFVIGSNTLSDISTHNYLSEVVDGKSFLKNRLIINNPMFNASMVLWKREFFSGISKEFTGYTLCGDWLFWMELASLGKVHISGRVLNYFRSHENNVSTKAGRSGLNYIETLKVINSLYKRNMINNKDYYRTMKVHFRAYYFNKDSLTGEVQKQILQIFSQPLTSKIIYYKIWISAFWRKFRSDGVFK